MSTNIIVLSDDSDDEFRWLSDGWYSQEVSGTQKAIQLMGVAREAIARGKDVPDTIEKLKQAGFTITRSHE